MRTKNHGRWRDLLIRLKEFLDDEKLVAPFEVYKFLGDGWVLLFDKDFDGSSMMDLLYRMCVKYKFLFKGKISPVLTTGGCKAGMTFGIDEGELVKIVMHGKPEYIGRPLNLAARLQGAIKQKDDEPDWKVLISKNCHIKLELEKVQRFAGIEVERKLANVAGGERYKARKIALCK